MPKLKKAFIFSDSNEMCKIIKNFTGNKVRYKFSSTVMISTYWGSRVIYHIDSVNEKNHINLIVL